MPRKLLLSLIAITFLCVPAYTQNFSRLERLAESLKDQAEQLAKNASRRLNRNSPNSTADIEQALLAEQFVASAKYLKSMIGDKYNIGDLRLAGNSLKTVADRFPATGGNSSDFRKTSESLRALLFELARTSTPRPPVNTRVDESRKLGRFFWSGSVDNEVRLRVTGMEIVTDTVSGRKLADGSYSFTSAFPSRAVTVGVRKIDGRGRVSVMQQPNAQNGFTAVIRIQDAGGGSDEYFVEIFWF